MIANVECSMPVYRASRWVLKSAGFVVFLSTITYLFYSMNWSWVIYGAVIGITFGLLVGLIVLANIPVKAQIAAVGAITGMGVDLAATATREDGPATALNSLASLVAKTAHAANTAAQKTGLPNPVELPISVGLWTFIGVLAITMLIGSLEKDAE